MMRGRLNKQITDEQKLRLAKNMANTEIQKVVFRIKNGKAPGPDGFTAAISQSSSY